MVDQRRPSRTLRAVALATAAMALAACSPDRVVGGGQLPPNVPDPSATRTPAGAMAAYRGALIELRRAVSGATLAGGMLTDEVRAPSYRAPIGASDTSIAVDSRNLPEYTDFALESPLAGLYVHPYADLQEVRNQAGQALGLLRDFSPSTSPALIGHMYAVEGYTEVLLADLYCSGVPLSTIDYNGDYTLRDGTPTQEIYAKAIALFDSAIALSSDSARILNLAAVGKARALLAQGEYGAAAAAVAAIPDGFSYALRYAPFRTDQGGAVNFAYIPSSGLPTYSVADTEGHNGLNYRSSGDPRTAAVYQGRNVNNDSLFIMATKYKSDGSSPIVLADWIEARLIEAEAALQAGDTTTWLATLNHLRETAIAPALPDTTDPGTPDARVDLLFRERAFWLFLTGHRQGDLRRLIRQYGRDPETVYPSGSYSGGTGAYGGAVTLPVPALERNGNPKYNGCINRGA